MLTTATLVNVWPKSNQLMTEMTKLSIAGKSEAAGSMINVKSVSDLQLHTELVDAEHAKHM